MEIVDHGSSISRSFNITGTEADGDDGHGTDKSHSIASEKMKIVLC